MWFRRDRDARQRSRRSVHRRLGFSTIDGDRPLNGHNWARSTLGAEALEERALLSVAPVGTALVYTAPVATAMTLKLNGTDYQVLNSSSGAVLAQQSAATTSAVAIVGSSGDDWLTVDWTAADVPGTPITFDGEGGANNLTVDDAASWLPTIYTLTSNSVGVNTTTISYWADAGSTMSVRLNTGADPADSVLVQSTASAPAKIVVGGPGQTVTIGSSGILAPIGGTLDVEGNETQLILDDHLNTAATAYGVSAETVTAGAAAIYYQGAATLTLDVGANAGDTVDMQSTLADLTTISATDIFRPTINIGPNLDNFKPVAIQAARLTTVGQIPLTNSVGVVTISDTATSGNHTYRIVGSGDGGRVGVPPLSSPSEGNPTHTLVLRDEAPSTAALPLFDITAANLSFTGGPGADVMDIENPGGAFAHPTLGGGAGDDVINVHALARVETGVDLVIADHQGNNTVNVGTNGNLNSIQGWLQINVDAPSASSSTINLDDSNSVNAIYSFNGGLSINNEPAHIVVSAINGTVNFTAGIGNHVADVGGFNALVTNVNFGDGVDVITVGGGAGTLNLYAGGGNDTIFVKGTAGTRTYINAGSGDDTIKVGTNPPVTPFDFRVGPLEFSNCDDIHNLYIDGGDGTDKLEVWDDYWELSPFYTDPVVTDDGSVIYRDGVAIIWYTNIEVVTIHQGGLFG